MATSTFPYVIVNAFTDSAFGGNPAAIVLLPPGSLTADCMLLDAPKMSSIAQSFAQPITVFLTPPIHVESSNSDENLIYDILFVVDKCFPPLCGHGTLAATKAICWGMFPGVLQDVTRNPVVKFRAPNDVILYSRMMDPGSRDSTADGEFYELTIPAHGIQEVTEEERNDVRKMLAEALGKDADGVELKYVGHRIHDTSRHRLLIVLGQRERLEGRDVNISAFLAGRYETYTLTHATPGQKTAFVSRSFMPVLGIMEDHVCGTAHALMMPYYVAQPDVDVVTGKEVFARQVSPRGGDLWVTLDEENGVVRLRGHAKLFARGEITF